MGKRDKFDYFDAFEKQTEVAVQEAELLIEAIESFTEAEHLKEVMERAHELEHKGDEINHAIFKTVATDFITPIEREDIINMSQYLDNIIDYIEDVMQRFYMYDVHFIHHDALEFASRRAAWRWTRPWRISAISRSPRCSSSSSST